MQLKNKYVIGCLVMFYEIEMLDEYIDSILNMVEPYENPENVTAHFCWNTQEYLESLDTEKISQSAISEKFFQAIKKLQLANLNVVVDEKTNADNFYNIAQYRRDLNYHWCEYNDFVIWGETDSMFPASGLHIIESVSTYAKDNDINRYTLTFGYRKNWDASWDVVTHTMFEDVQYIDEKEWIMSNEASSKSYMTMERMNEINDMVGTDYDVRITTVPKFDGSCLVISSDLIKCGVNIPHALTHCAEDTSFGEVAKIILGNKYCQFVVKNVLRVHNRRHPRKRNYIAGEDNPNGFGGMNKGAWWDILEKTSKYNLSILRDSQKKFMSLQEVVDKIDDVRKTPV